MLFHVRRTRNHGRLMPRHQMAGDVRSGHLRVRDESIAELNRTVKVAELLTETGSLVDGMKLYDATLLACHIGWWSVSGYERIEEPAGRVTDYAQSWVMIPDGEE